MVQSKNPADLFTIQKVLGLIIASVGAAVSVVNLLVYLPDLSFLSAVVQPTVLYVLLSALFILLVSFIDHPLPRFIQIIVLAGNCAIAILDSFDSIYGLGLFLLAVMIAYKYEFLQKRPFIKLGLCLLLLFSLIVFSVKRANVADELLYGLDAILFVIMFLAVSFIIFRNELLLALKAQEKRLTSPLDLEILGISAAEKRVLSILVRKKASDKQIAAELYISVGTVKNHIHEIKKKLGVTTRYALIDKCRNNFREEKAAPSLGLP